MAGHKLAGSSNILGRYLLDTIHAKVPHTGVGEWRDAIKWEKVKSRSALGFVRVEPESAWQHNATHPYQLVYTLNGVAYIPVHATS